MARKVNLPEDANSNAVQVLSPDYLNPVAQTVAAASDNLELPTTTEIIQITNTQDTWINFGTDNTVTAVVGSHILLLPGERVYRVPVGATYIAFIRGGTTDGVISVVCMM